MKAMQTGFVCGLLALGIALGGCAKPPVDEMDRAVEAVTRAENDADAVLYASGTLVRARESLNRMRAEADSKRYDAAKSYASEAVNIAEQAISEGKTGAARMRDEAAALVSDLRPAMAEAEQGIKTAQTAGLPLDFETLGQDFEAVRMTAEQAETALADSQYQDALERGRSARAGLSDINRKLTETVLVTSRKK